MGTPEPQGNLFQCLTTSIVIFFSFIYVKDLVVGLQG